MRKYWGWYIAGWLLWGWLFTIGFFTGAWMELWKTDNTDNMGAGTTILLVITVILGVVLIYILLEQIIHYCRDKGVEKRDKKIKAENRLRIIEEHIINLSNRMDRLSAKRR